MMKLEQHRTKTQHTIPCNMVLVPIFRAIQMNYCDVGNFLSQFPRQRNEILN